MKKKFVEFLLYYYFIMLNLQMFSDHTVYYILLVAPLALLFIMSFEYIFSSKQNKYVVLFFIHYILTVFIALLRIDFVSVLNISQFSIPFIFFLNNPQRINNNLINKIFVLSIILAFVGYLIGTNIYGITPFNSGTYRSRTWRVSLFLDSNLSVSAAFANLVFFWNLIKNTKYNRYLFLFFSGYFVILSANKTAITVLIFGVVAVFLYRYLITQKAVIKAAIKVLLTSLPMVFIGLIVFSGYLLNTLISNVIFENSFIFEFLNIGDYNLNILSGRDALWNAHLSIFRDHLLFGAGDFTLHDYFTDIGANSESKFTYILARDGIISFLFFAGIIYLIYYSLIFKNAFAYVVISSLTIYMFFYGSFSNGYNFGLIVLLVMYADELAKNRHLYYL